MLRILQTIIKYKLTSKRRFFLLLEFKALSEYDLSLSEYDVSLSEYDLSLSDYDLSLSEYDVSLSESDFLLIYGIYKI